MRDVAFWSLMCYRGRDVHFLAELLVGHEVRAPLAEILDHYCVDWYLQKHALNATLEDTDRQTGRQSVSFTVSQSDR